MLEEPPNILDQWNGHADPNFFSFRNFQAIFAPSNNYFTEQKLWGAPV